MKYWLFQTRKFPSLYGSQPEFLHSGAAFLLRGAGSDAKRVCVPLRPQSAGEASGAEHLGKDEAPGKEKLRLLLLKASAYFPKENKSACKRLFLGDSPINRVIQTTPCQPQDCPVLPDAFFSPLPIVSPMHWHDPMKRLVNTHCLKEMGMKRPCCRGARD